MSASAVAKLSGLNVAAFDSRKKVLRKIAGAQLADAVGDGIIVRVHVLADVGNARLTCLLQIWLRRVYAECIGALCCKLCALL